jgi:hypothetical protein
VIRTTVSLGVELADLTITGNAIAGSADRPERWQVQVGPFGDVCVDVYVTAVEAQAIADAWQRVANSLRAAEEGE